MERRSGASGRFHWWFIGAYSRGLLRACRLDRTLRRYRRTRRWAGRCRREKEFSVVGFEWTVRKEIRDANSHGSNALRNLSGMARKFAFESSKDCGAV